MHSRLGACVAALAVWLGGPAWAGGQAEEAPATPPGAEDAAAPGEAAEGSPDPASAPVDAQDEASAQVDAEQDPLASPEYDVPAEEPRREAFRYRIRLLATGRLLGAADLPYNPDNRLLQLPNRLGGLEGRPEFQLTLGDWDFSFKPRFRLTLSGWQGGLAGGDGTTTDEFVLEWFTRWAVTDSLFLSFGKENVQWGPSQVFSPSNPFFLDNNRVDPVTELRGTYFARATWTPSMRWTVNLLANVFEDEAAALAPQQLRPFERSYAVKLDYQGEQMQGSLIGTYGERSRFQVGGFAIWTVTDALLLYGEGKLAARNDALYPLEDPGSAFGARMGRLPRGDQPNATFVLGQSYTLEMNLTLTAEYLHATGGYDASGLDRFFALRRDVAASLLAQDDRAPLAAELLGQTTSPGLRFLAKHYGMLQARYAWGDEGEVLLRWFQSFDDGSGNLVGMGVWPLGDNLEALLLGGINFGADDSELAGVLRYHALLGLEYTF